MDRPLNEYAMIADGRTAALIHTSGSIDWLCWPCFDSRAMFTSLLGDESNGFWRIAPAGEFKTTRQYKGRSLVLETEFETSTGRVRLIDWMGLSNGTQILYRRVVGLTGHVQMRLRLSVRFDYGSIHPWITGHSDHSTWMVGGPDSVELRTQAPLTRRDGNLECEFAVAKGDIQDFTLIWRGDDASHAHADRASDPGADLNRTVQFWEGWADRCQYQGPYRDLVLRSFLTLKGLIYTPSGGIVAAPTTSLPEDFGGVRNWDYRYCWIRDATYTLMTFLQAGYTEEAEAWRSWLVRAIAGTPEQMNIMYGIRGERRLPEVVLD